MPTVANMRLPPPRSWEEFQNIVLSALRVRWRTSDLHHNGRQGQPQSGVDICGRDDRGRFVGVQCKLSGGELQLAAISKEVRMAESFVPPIEAFFIATTAKRDAKIQEALRVLSQARASRGQFEVVALFWDDLASDLAGNREEFRKHYPELMGGGPGTAGATPVGEVDEIEAVFGPDYRPPLTVHGDEWFRMRVYAPAFMRPTFDPDEEDAFLAAVKETFWEDEGAVLEASSSTRVGVENRDPGGRFHRRWVWWTGGDGPGMVGAIGMAGTLRDLCRTDTYSVAEMAADLARLLAMAGNSGLGGDHRTVFEIKPLRLVPAWDLSDLRARGKADGTLGGIVSGGAACTAHSTQHRYVWNGDLRDLRARAAQLAGSAVVHAAKDVHGARIRPEQLIESIPGLLDLAWRVRRM